MTLDECMRLRGAEKDAEGKILVPGDMLIFVAGHPAVYGKQMLFFLDKELSKRSQIAAPDRSGRTVAKRESTGERRVPILGESGEQDEPSEAEFIELATNGSISVNKSFIRDEYGNKYDLSKNSEAISR